MRVMSLRVRKYADAFMLLVQFFLDPVSHALGHFSYYNRDCCDRFLRINIIDYVRGV